MNVNTELNAFSLNIFFDGYVQCLEIQRVMEDKTVYFPISCVPAQID